LIQYELRIIDKKKKPLNIRLIFKSKLIEIQVAEEKKQELRQRRKKTSHRNSESGDEDTNSNNKLAKRSIKTGLMRYGKRGGPGGQKQTANRFLVGLTFTVGVAAVAMYAINSNASQPQDIISKFYHLLSYKDF
jgi:hypothetical protein